MRSFVRCIGFVPMVIVVLVSGCVPPSSSTTEPNSPPNNSPSSSQILQLDSNGEISLSGTVTTPKDVDVFDVGPVEPGDRLIVQVDAANGSLLDPVVGLFDASEDLINYNDDVDYAAGNYNSFIDHTVRLSSTHCYIAITDSAYGPSSGGYVMDLQVTRGGPVPPPEHQDVLLDFSGATVAIPGDRTYVIPAFDAGSVDSRLQGQDASVEARIKQILEERYAAYDITFYLPGDPGLPSADQYSTLVFGGGNPADFGISQDVDHYNQDHSDDGIIFTSGWTNPFSFTPSTDAILTSLGNVAAHELGHLLGLEHTEDVTELMDTSGGPDTILVPQDFHLAPLFPYVFPFGFQDDPELLLETLGAN